MMLGLSLGLTRVQGGGLSALPSGFAYLINDDGDYLVDDDGAYMIAETS